MDELSVITLYFIHSGHKKKTFYHTSDTLQAEYSLATGLKRK